MDITILDIALFLLNYWILILFGLAVVWGTISFAFDRIFEKKSATHYTDHGPYVD